MYKDVWLSVFECILATPGSFCFTTTYSMYWLPDPVQPRRHYFGQWMFEVAQEDGTPLLWGWLQSKTCEGHGYALCLKIFEMKVHVLQFHGCYQKRFPLLPKVPNAPRTPGETGSFECFHGRWGDGIGWRVRPGISRLKKSLLLVTLWVELKNHERI